MGFQWALLILMALVVGGTLTWATTRRAESMIQRWADGNGYQIVQLEWRWFRLGPYFWKASKNQMVYRVEIIDWNGNPAQCWIRCGSWLLGVLSDEIDVTWD